MVHVPRVLGILTLSADLDSGCFLLLCALEPAAQLGPVTPKARPTTLWCFPTVIEGDVLLGIVILLAGYLVTASVSRSHCCIIFFKYCC